MMKAKLTGTVLSLAALALLATPAMAGYRVKVPTGGDFVFLTVNVVNLSNDYVYSAHYNQEGSTFTFQSYDLSTSFDYNYIPPLETGTVTFEFDAGGSFPEIDNFQLPLTGFANNLLSDPGQSPVFVYDDPGLKVDVASENAGPCGSDPNCTNFTLPYTITIPADGKSPVPEAGTAVSFGIGLLGLAGVMLYGRRYSPALKSQALKSPNASV